MISESRAVMLDGRKYKTSHYNAEAAKIVRPDGIAQLVAMKVRARELYFSRLLDGQKPGTNPAKWVAVRCITSGECYPSIAEAARGEGVRRGRLTTELWRTRKSGGTATTRGKQFEYFDPPAKPDKAMPGNVVIGGVTYADAWTAAEYTKLGIHTIRNSIRRGYVTFRDVHKLEVVAAHARKGGTVRRYVACDGKYEPGGVTALAKQFKTEDTKLCAIAAAGGGNFIVRRRVPCDLVTPDSSPR